MTKNVIAAGVAVFICAAAHAQTGNSDVVTVNLKLNPIQTLIVNPSQKTVDLVYVTKEDYGNGVQATLQDHLQVYSTGGFNITAQTSGSVFQGGEGDLPIGGTIGLIPREGTTKPVPGTGYLIPDLNTAPLNVIEATTGTNDGTFNMTYWGIGQDFLRDYYKAGTDNTFTTQVTYTILPR